MLALARTAFCPLAFEMHEEDASFASNRLPIESLSGCASNKLDSAILANCEELLVSAIASDFSIVDLNAPVVGKLGFLSSGAPSGWSDWLGMAASIGCAIHCAAMPFVFASLPAWGLTFLADEAFHRGMAAMSVGLALAAFIPGWRTHRRLLPVVVGVVGISMICWAAYGLSDQCCASCSSSAAAAPAAVCTNVSCEHCVAGQGPSRSDAVAVQEAVTAAGGTSLATTTLPAGIAPWLTPIGGFILVAAHLLNRRFGCLCGCCDDGESTA